MDDKVTTSAVDKENRVLAFFGVRSGVAQALLDAGATDVLFMDSVDKPAEKDYITFDQSKIEERVVAAGLPTEPEEPEYEVVYPNYKMEQRGREVPFRPSPKKGTPVKYQRIPMCGHKFIPHELPRHSSCESCWFTFFQVHGELTQAVEEVYQKQGEAFLVKLRGRRFVTNFLKFMATVAAYKAAMNATQEQNVGIRRPESGDAGEDTSSATSTGEGSTNS